MKKTKIIYWTTTGIFTAMMVLSSIQYFTSEDVMNTFKHLGFSDYFRIELGIAKILGAIALILPMVSQKIKEWAYAGFGIVLISAAIAHLASEDGIVSVIAPIVFFIILATSYTYKNKLASATDNK